MMNCGTLIVIQQNNSSVATKTLEMIDLRGSRLEFLSPVWKAASVWTDENEHICTQNTSKHSHVNTQARAHGAFVLLPQLFPSERGWLVGGRRGLATGAGQRNSRLFTFLLQPSLFRLFSPLSSVFLYSPHPTPLSVPLRGCRLCNERPET